jgi:hypothetical protein
MFCHFVSHNLYRLPVLNKSRCHAFPPFSYSPFPATHLATSSSFHSLHLRLLRSQPSHSLSLAKSSHLFNGGCRPVAFTFCFLCSILLLKTLCSSGPPSHVRRVHRAPWVLTGKTLLWLMRSRSPPVAPQWAGRA